MLPARQEAELGLNREDENSLIVLKLGGSVITEKERNLTPNLNSIDRLAREIAEANVKGLMIVHGGGSYGHPLAKQYNIKEGYKDASQIEGLLKTHQTMLELNKLVVDSLIYHNIAAFSVAPSSCVVTKAGRIKTFYDDALRMFLKTGFVPVLFGDTVLDTEIGFTILSGDQLVATLATEFNATKLVFGVDVDGLYTTDPKADASAQLISNTTFEELKKMMPKIRGSKTTDVTGGMLGKVLEIINMMNASIQVIIVNAIREGNIYKALRGEKVVGTIIREE